MISKKTMVAVVVGSMFTTPSFAQILYKGDSVASDNGVLEATNKDVDKGLEVTATPNVVKLTAYNNPENLTGSLSLSLTDYKKDFSALWFLEASGMKGELHKNQLSLNSTSLNLSSGVIFSNASIMVDIADKDKQLDIRAENTVDLQNSVLNGSITHYYSRPNSEYDHKYFINSTHSKTEINLRNGSNWNGDLLDVISNHESVNSSVVNENLVKGQYFVKLNDGSSWTGGVDIAKNSTVEVTLDSTSSWTVNKDSKINSIQLDNVATRQAVEKNGVAIADGVSLTIADGFSNKSSTINNLQTGAGSTLAVEKANVTLNNFAGKGAIVVNKDGKVEVKAATDKVNATFTSLDGSKLTTNDQVNANVTIAGALADEMGMDAVIEAYNTNKNFNGKGTITFSGGLLGDDVYGQNNDQNQFVQQGTRKNAQLVSIGESTAITMMQWRADADDMAQRMGDLRNNNGTVGVWARTFGGKAEAGHVDNKYYGVQAGVDTQIATTGPKQFVGGAVSYTTGDATFANGTGENYMGTLTGYSTWLFDNGAYVDVAAKWGKLNNEFDLGVEGKQLAGKYSTQAIALTVESGHRFPITNLTYVEPQVAFTASHIFGEDYGTTHGATIEQDSINSYVARVGVQAGLNCPDNMGSVFVRASYLYDFDGETSTVARMANAKDANRFDQDFGGGWYELGLGMNVNFTKNLYGYADFEYVTGGEIKTPYRWNAGLRYAF